MRTRAMTEPSAGLTEASSPPEGLGIQSPSHAPELTGSISNRSKTSFAVAVIVDLRKPGKGLGAGGESPAGRRGPLPHLLYHRRLKGGVVPFRKTLGAADAHARIARGGAALLHRAHVKRIADDIAVRGVQRQVDERFRIARQQWRQRGVYRNARGAQAANGFQALGRGRAVRLIQAAHALAIRGDGKAHAQRGACGEALEAREVAQDQRAARLYGEDLRRTLDQLVEQARHHAFGLLGRLIGVHQRRAVDGLVGPQRCAQQGGRVALEGGEAAPMVPVVRFQPAVDAHGGDVTIGASERAVARRRERVREARLGDEARGGGENAGGLGAVDLETHSYYCRRGGSPPGLRGSSRPRPPDRGLRSNWTGRASGG